MAGVVRQEPWKGEAYLKGSKALEESYALRAICRELEAKELCFRRQKAQVCHFSFTSLKLDIIKSWFSIATSKQMSL